LLFLHPGTERKSHQELYWENGYLWGTGKQQLSQQAVGGEDSGMADFQFGVRRVAHALASSCRFVGFGRDEREC
jgi:hypothetical protein